MASFWTEDKIAQLILMAPEFRAREIGDALGASRDAVIGKLFRLGVPLGSARGPQDAVFKSRCSAKAEQREANRRARQAYLARKDAERAARKIGLVHRKSPTPVPLEAPAHVNVPVTIANLRPSHCRWPLGDPRHETFRYCGCASEAGRPYCPEHVAIARGEPAQRRRA